jgi:hypothetical protein
MYYLRSKPSEGAMKVTVDPNLQKNLQKTNISNNDTLNDKFNETLACESCSA